MRMNASGFSRRVADLDLSAATDTQLMQLEDAFRSIADSIATARKVMSELEAGLALRATQADQAPMLALPFEEDRQDVERAIRALVPGKNAVEIESKFRKRVLDHFDIEGWIAAGVLSCLVRFPGRFVSHAELAAAAGAQSDKSGVIRVYICQLRASLALKGYSGEAIETGRGAYRIVRSAAFEIINAVAQV